MTVNPHAMSVKPPLVPETRNLHHAALDIKGAHQGFRHLWLAVIVGGRRDQRLQRGRACPAAAAFAACAACALRACAPAPPALRRLGLRRLSLTACALRRLRLRRFSLSAAASCIHCAFATDTLAFIAASARVNSAILAASA